MDLICHYTRSESAIKILKSKKLWATDYRFLDDAKENKIYLEILNRIISSSKNQANEKFLHDFMTFMLNKSRVYVCSFTKHNPEGSEHRYGNLAIARYFGKDNWVGLVFKEDSIFERLKSESNTLGNLTKACNSVYYIDPNTVATDIGLIEYIYQIYHNIYNENDLLDHLKKHWNISESDLKSTFYRKMGTLLSSFNSCKEFLGQNNYVADLILHQIMVKHICFKDEKEFRVTFQYLLDEQDYSEFTTLVEPEPKPHLQFDFDYEDVEKIIIGPGQNAIITKDHLNEVLLINKDTSGLGKRILTSDIPWRT